MRQWAATTGRAVGAVLTIAMLWQLAERWYRGRLAPDWRPRTLEESQRILDTLGLRGTFWSLRG